MEMEDAQLGADKGAMDSMQDMAHQPTGFPPLQYAYDYHPMHHPQIHYEWDPYVAQYCAVQGFPDHPSSFIHDPWEDGHADYEGQLQYMRGGSQYGPQDPNNQFSAYQGPYPPLRAYPNDAIPGYYYYGMCTQPHSQFHQLPALCNSPHPDLTSGMAPGPPQQQSHLPPAQSTALWNKDTPPKSKVDATFLQGKLEPGPWIPPFPTSNLSILVTALEMMVPYQPTVATEGTRNSTTALLTSTRVPLFTSAASLPTTLLGINMCPLPAQADQKLFPHVRGISSKLQNPVISAEIQSGPDDSPAPPERFMPLQDLVMTHSAP
ncbi:hypothetical protein BKA83DRAFT_4130475 [Pisolithus microcarpus]|nr:hypothetical protein BKA83DRAFT_4130475 [Pisolithus microcarpus]